MALPLPIRQPYKEETGGCGQYVPEVVQDGKRYRPGFTNGMGEEVNEATFTDTHSPYGYGEHGYEVYEGSVNHRLYKRRVKVEASAYKVGSHTEEALHDEGDRKADPHLPRVIPVMVKRHQEAGQFIS